MQTHQQLQQRILDWAVNCDDLRAIIQVGSLAREDSSADIHSDLDLILFTTAPEKYAANASWLDQLGECWLPVCSQNSRGDSEWLVLFANGVKGDFFIATATGRQPLPEMLAGFPYHDVLLRGFRVLLDQTGVPLDLAYLSLRSPDIHHPAQDEFDSVVNRALLSTARTAKFVRRQDLWRGQQEMSGELRPQLLTMIEWHARARSGLALDTWYEGRNLAKWADPLILPLLPRIYAVLDAADMQRALRDTVDLVDRLGRDTALALSLRYPSDGQSRAMAWLKTILSS